MKTKMACHKCGAEMNCHAQKISYLASDEDAGLYAGLGGVLEEIHTCPACGNIETRPVLETHQGQKEQSR